ncbi:MAG: DoxX family protein [Actinomycetota bacterium]|nr:DoxX family protein [Actinomycetota bacterium]
MSLRRSTLALAGLFAASGTIHLVRPAVYEQIVPSWVPAAHGVVLASGVAELLLAAGLVLPPTRRLAGWGSVGLLVGVYPANITMTMDAAKSDNKPMLAATLARLPLQLPMIKAAFDATRG